jgi:hypothetical protein
MTLLLISTAIFLGYNAFIVSKFGIPKSLSDSFYLLNEVRNNLGYLFTIALYGMAFTLLPVWMDIPVGENVEFLKFFCGAFLAFVGAAPMFKSVDKPWHGIFAMMSAITGLLWIIIATPFWYVVLIILAIMLLLMWITKTSKCYVYWLEMVMFVSIYTINYIYLL